MEKIRPKKVEPPPQPITPKKLQGVFSNTQPVLPTPQTDDEIDRIKRENKAKEAAEAAARAASGKMTYPTVVNNGSINLTQPSIEGLLVK